MNEENLSQWTDRLCINDDAQAVEPPTLGEVEKTIWELKKKTRKAVGKNELPAEHTELITELPVSWLEGLIPHLYKKGHRL